MKRINKSKNNTHRVIFNKDIKKLFILFLIFSISALIFLLIATYAYTQTEGGYILCGMGLGLLLAAAICLVLQIVFFYISQSKIYKQHRIDKAI
jgi:hypothetical protein